MNDFETHATPDDLEISPESAPLTVAYVLKMFPRFSETFILNEILELERRGVQIIVFSMKTPNEKIQQADLSLFRGRSLVVPALERSNWGLHLRSHLACLLRSPRRYWSTLIFARRRGTRPAWEKFLLAPFIVREARARGVEHFHAHFASGPARQAKLASFLSGIPFSFTAHAKDLFWTGHQHGKNNKLKKRLRSASFVITISEFNREFVQNLNFRVPRRKVVTLYNGLDLRKWKLLRPGGQSIRETKDERHARSGDTVSGGPPLLLSVGRLVPKKGFHVLIEACRRLRETGERFECVIAGEGPEEEKLRGRIQEAGLEGIVHLAGPIPQDRLIAEHYLRAAALIQASVVSADGDQDGIPMVILEALAMGLPVVSTSVSGIGEAVMDEETGLLVPPDDPQRLAEAMRRIMSDASLASRVAVGGRALIEKRFDLKQNAKVLHHLMEFSAHGIVRWSNDKLREKIGLPPLEDPDSAERARHARVEI